MWIVEQSSYMWKVEEGDYRDDITAIVFTFPLPWKTQHLGSTKLKKKS